jgi:hypothetical protein
MKNKTTIINENIQDALDSFKKQHERKSFINMVVGAISYTIGALGAPFRYFTASKETDSKKIENDNDHTDLWNIFNQKNTLLDRYYQSNSSERTKINKSLDMVMEIINDSPGIMGKIESNMGNAETLQDAIEITLKQSKEPVEEKLCLLAKELCKKGEYSNDLVDLEKDIKVARFIEHMENKLDDEASLTEADISTWNSEKINAARSNVTKNSIDLLTRSNVTDDQISQQLHQLGLVNESYKTQKENELSNVLYFGLPLAHCVPILALINFTPIVGLNYVLVPTAILMYSLAYTYNIYNQGHADTKSAKILLGLTGLALITTTCAAIAFAGFLPVALATFGSIAAVINIGLFVYSLGLESDRVNQAKDLYNNQLTKLVETLYQANLTPKKKELIQKNLQVVLDQYSTLVDTVKAPWSKASHNNDLVKLRRNIELSKFYEVINGGAYQTDPRLIGTTEKIAILKDFYTDSKSVHERAMEKIKPFLEGMKKKSLFSQLPNIKVNNLDDLKSTINLLKNCYVDESSLDNSAIIIALKTDPVLKLLIENEIDIRLNSPLTTEILKKLCNKGGEGYEYIDELLKDISGEADAKIKEDKIFQQVDKKKAHLDSKWNQDTLYYVINFGLITANITLMVGPILGISGIFLSPPLMMTMSIGVGLVVTYSAVKMIMHSSFMQVIANSVRSFVNTVTKIFSSRSDMTISHEQDHVKSTHFSNGNGNSNKQIEMSNNTNSPSASAQNDNENRSGGGMTSGGGGKTI